MNGWRQQRVHHDTYVMSHQFPLGAVTSDNKGVYRCRCGVEPPTLTLTELNRWTMLSNLVEVTGTGKQGHNGVKEVVEGSRWMSLYPCHLVSPSRSFLICQVGMFMLSPEAYE